MLLAQSRYWGRTWGVGIVVATCVVIATSPASALTVADGEFRIDVPIEEAESCVLLPEASPATEGCDGLDRMAFGKKLLAGSRKGIEHVSVILVRGEPTYLLTVLRDSDAQTELDRAGANEFARVIRARISGHDTRATEGSPGARVPWEERINGVQVIGFDAAAESASNDRGLNHQLFYVASTRRGRYTISFACPSTDAETMRDVGREALSTLRATPAKPAVSRLDAASRAGAIGDAIYHALSAVAELVVIALVIWAVVRHRKKAREQAGSWGQPPS
jgi:hypothetical protein